jgi:Fe-S-cluster-containing hydrogenase component 2
MPKRVRMVAEIVAERCTGCRLCEQVCPTVAIAMRARRPDEAGQGRNIAVLAPEACYNAQACVEICPDDAIEMVELAQPFEVGFSLPPVDADAVKALCRKAGYARGMQICVCTDTKAGDIAAAVLSGAHTPEAVSLATGARTGCQELCLNPILQILASAGHADAPRNPKNGFQWYGRSATLYEHMQPDGSLPDFIHDAYSEFPLEKEFQDMAKLKRH